MVNTPEGKELEEVFGKLHSLDRFAKVFHVFSCDLVVKCRSDQLKRVGPQLDSVLQLLLNLIQIFIQTKRLSLVKEVTGKNRVTECSAANGSMGVPLKMTL